MYIYFLYYKHLSRSVSEITKKEFNCVKYRNSTELSKYIWQLKDLNIAPKILWEIAAVMRCAARTVF